METVDVAIKDGDLANGEFTRGQQIRVRMDNSAKPFTSFTYCEWVLLTSR